MNNNGISEKDSPETALNVLIGELLAEAKNIPEADFAKWYEKKRKIFNTGIKNPPTKEEFIKYLNYASAIKFD
ncbi:MAG: hypothetical protein M1276_02625 [Deltaproteobacteria bacterium]|jgi:hypothetical protein|nr:hypothetical protein [Deltaproteobacteria bacterium]MDA8158469.1 hypothetical protein [Deltaproteobacteria bacterium]